MALSEYETSMDESTPLLRRTEAHRRERWGARHTLALLGFFGIMIEYCQRVTLSVDIVSMVVSFNSSNSSDSDSFCPASYVNGSSSIKEHKGEFEWNKQTQGIILSAFFWGYTCSNFLGGRLSEYIGGKMVFGLGILASSLLTLIIPICARASVGLLIACRVLMGLVQGVTFPSMNILLATWILPEDKSQFGAFVYSGFQIGTVIGMMLSGWLCDQKLLGGWPLTFYVFGVFGVIWVIFWYFLVYERPEDHPRISNAELRRIFENGDSIKVPGTVAIPWKGLMTSLPFWAVMACGMGSDYGFYTLLTELPTYLHDVQHFDIIDNGLMSSIPYFLMWVISILWGGLMIIFTRKKILSIVNIRRLSMAVAMYGPMVGLIIMCFVDCNPFLAIAILCIFGMLNGAQNCGYLCSHQDMAPNLAGTLLGITNTLGSLMGIAAPAITSAIIGDNGTLWEWRTVFLISSGLYLFSCSIYIIFISAEVQPWNEPKTISNDIEEEEDVVDGRYKNHLLST